MADTWILGPKGPGEGVPGWVLGWGPAAPVPGRHRPHDSGGMGKHLVILGGGTAGTMTANRLCRTHGQSGHRITVVDQDDDHLYQPGLLFAPFGLAQPHHLLRSRPRQLDAAVDDKQARIDRVDLDARTVAPHR